MKNSSLSVLLAGLFLLLGIQGQVFAQASANAGITVSAITCEPGSTTRFSYVATWSDSAGAGAYNVKLGNQCTLERQQCTTNAKQSCQVRCVKGKCRGEFAGCMTGRAGYLTIVPVMGKGIQEKRYAAPTCK